MITSLALLLPSRGDSLVLERLEAACRELRPRIQKLAKKGPSHVGAMAVEALVALNPSEPREQRLQCSVLAECLIDVTP